MERRDVRVRMHQLDALPLTHVAKVLMWKVPDRFSSSLSPPASHPPAGRAAITRKRVGGHPGN